MKEKSIHRIKSYKSNILATLALSVAYIVSYVKSQVTTSNLLTHTLTTQAVTTPATLHETPKPMISSMSPKTFYVLDTAASNILTFEQSTPPNLALTDTTAYVVPGELPPANR